MAPMHLISIIPPYEPWVLPLQLLLLHTGYLHHLHEGLTRASVHECTLPE